MYSLLVWHEVEQQSEGIFVITKDRFLEYTSGLISNQLKTLSNEAIECIKSWPCALLQEGRGKERAYVGKISAIENTSTSIKLTIAAVPSSQRILNDTLWKIRANLDIERTNIASQSS